MKVVIARRAERDLTEICAWIAEDRPRAAVKMLDRLMEATAALSRQPLRYPRLAMTGLRQRPVGPYLIFYRVDDVVTIVRILHAARDWPALLDEA